MVKARNFYFFTVFFYTFFIMFFKNSHPVDKFFVENSIFVDNLDLKLQNPTKLYNFKENNAIIAVDKS